MSFVKLFLSRQKARRRAELLIESRRCVLSPNTRTNPKSIAWFGSRCARTTKKICVMICPPANSFLDLESVVQINGLRSLSVAVFSCSPEQSSDNMVQSILTARALLKRAFRCFRADPGTLRNMCMPIASPRDPVMRRSSECGK